MRKRDETIDIIKGVGIILMVFYHAHSPGRDFVYLFHMALFFICSGYCYSEKSVFDPAGFVKRKVLSLYLPCFLSGVLVLSLTNVLLKIHVYSYEVYKPLTITKYVKELVKCLLFGGGRQLLGANWFFRTLFLTSVTYLMIHLVIFRLIHQERVQDIVIASICCFCTCIGCYLGNHLSFGKYFNFLTVISIFDIGYLLKKYQVLDWLNSHRQKQVAAFTVSVLALVLMSRFGTLSINNNTVKNPFYFWTSSVAGFIMIYSLSRVIKRWKIRRFFVYCGSNSIWIMFLHYIGFKLVTLVEIIVFKMPIEKLGEYPVYITKNGLWFAYGVMGVAIPLLFVKIIKNKRDD